MCDLDLARFSLGHKQPTIVQSLLLFFVFFFLIHCSSAAKIRNISPADVLTHSVNLVSAGVSGRGLWQ